tara:strand:+ start:478 stop:1365 length:888 start_codon:yes stop_codon:yes gene_type:complete
MSAEIIDGKSFSKNLIEKVKNAVSGIMFKYNFKPGLAVVLVGENPASEVYVKNKVLQTEYSGMNSIEHRLTETTSQDELIKLVDNLNNDDSIDGILVQLPLPKHIDEQSIINFISPEKDVDGFNVTNVGLLSTGGNGLIPCTPLGCLLLLQDYFNDLSGLNAVIVGRSNIVGKPMAQLLIQSSCTVTITHSKTRNLQKICKEADILVAAIGKAEFIDESFIKNGAVVIDVGINRLPKDKNNRSKLVGDVKFSPVSKVAKAITPVPGGVGPMTIACLLRNTVSAACKRRKVKEPEM